MDTLFRLVNHGFDASSSLPHKGEHLKEACAADRRPLYMDEAFPSSSSERPHSATPTPSVDSNADLSFLRDLNIDLAFPANGGGRWASKLLIECARAVAACDGQRAQRLMWALNELASPYGDVDQKIAACFLQGVFARATSSGVRTLRALADAADRNCSFDATRRTTLRFQELSPWSPFGHVAANGAILEAFLESGKQRLHILDLSNTLCTQWPTLLEALATRSADVTPHVSITTVVSPSSSVPKVMKEIGQRMERFARLMGVPFRFNAVHHPSGLSGLDLDRLALGEGDAAALVVNCVNALHGIPPSGRRRDDFLAALSRFRPLTVTVVEEVAELDAAGEEDGEAFVRRVGESLRFFSAYLDSLESSFPRTSNERLALEREAGRAVLDLVACPAAESGERRSVAEAWARRLRAAGFEAAAFSDDVADDVRGLLRRYREDWSMREAGSGGAGMFLAWKEQPVVWASAWNGGSRDQTDGGMARNDS